MKIDYQYIFGFDLIHTSKDAFENFINVQGISKEEFEVAISGDCTCLQLKYENGWLAEVRQIDESNNTPRLNQEPIGAYEYFQNQQNPINYLVPSKKPTNSYLGEGNQEKFKAPITDAIDLPFQIVGKLSRKDEVFNWLPMEDLYLTYPLYSGIGGYLFLDYSDPLNPVYCPSDLLIDYVFGKIDRKGVHKFDQTFLSVKSICEIEERIDLSFEYWHYGMTGVPAWIQHPELPKCPKSGRFMKFVCKIDSREEIKVRDTNLKPTFDFWGEYSNYLRFWGSGSLYVFIEPESKIVGYLIQDT